MKCFKMRIVLFFLVIFSCDQFVKAYKADKDSILVNGDLMIIALFPVHRKGCELIQERAGMQRVEVVLQKIEEIDRNKKEKDCSLGIYIKDTCAGHYSRETLEEELLPIESKRIVGMIGPATSEETFPYARSSLPSHQYVHIGYGATSSKLITTGKPENPYSTRSYSSRNNFVRVVPSDRDQVTAIIEIVKQIPNCTAINVVSSPDEYGDDGAEEFRKQSQNTEVCVHRYYKADAALRSRNYFDVLNETAHMTQVLVCFCDGDTLRDILREIKQSNMTRKFIFIATDRWVERDHVLNGFENEAEGNFLINIKPQNYFTGNIDYTRLKSKTALSTENTWIAEFENLPICGNDPDTQCKENKYWKYDPKLAFVSQSIQIIADLVGNKQKGNCQLERERMDGPYGHGPPIFRQPSWKDAYRSPKIDPDKVFDQDGNPKYRRYEIFNFQKVNGSFKLQSVGTWENNKLQWIGDVVKLPNISKFNANCRNGCNPGERIVKDNCCWTCSKCSIFSISDGNLTECRECDICKTPNQEGSECVVKSNNLLIGKGERCFSIFIALLGVALTSYTAYVFYKHRRTPTVKFSSPHLSYIIFCGMGLAYSTTILNLMQPNVFTCTVLRFIPSISMTMIYSPLLMKMNRISRALSATKRRLPTLRMKYLSATFLAFVSLMFVLTDIIVCTIQYGIAASEGRIQPDLNCIEETIIVLCTDSITEFNVRHLVNVFLLAYCALYAYNNGQHLPDNFNETNFVIISCGATALVWYIFYAYYASLQEDEHWTMRVFSLSLALSLSALINLVCMYFPKLLIILYRPRQNHRAFYSTATEMRCFFGNTESRCPGFSSVNMESTAGNPTMTTEQNITKKDMKLFYFLFIFFFFTFIYVMYIQMVLEAPRKIHTYRYRFKGRDSGSKKKS